MVIYYVRRFHYKLDSSVLQDSLFFLKKVLSFYYTSILRVCSILAIEVSSTPSNYTGVKFLERLHKRQGIFDF